MRKFMLTPPELARLLSGISQGGRALVGPIYLTWDDDEGAYYWTTPIVAISDTADGTSAMARQRLGIYSKTSMTALGRITARQAAHAYVTQVAAIAHALAKSGRRVRVDIYEDHDEFLEDVGAVQPLIRGPVTTALAELTPELHDEATAIMGQLVRRVTATDGRA